MARRLRTLASLVAVLFANPIWAASRITQVVVFPDRAQVTRQARIACGPRAVAEFAELPPAADPRSVRAQAGSAQVEGIEVEQRGREAAFAPRAAELDERIRKLEAEAQARRDERDRAHAQLRTQAQYGRLATALVAREMVLPTPDLKAWGAALDGTLAGRVRAGNAEVEVNAKLRELSRQLDELRQKRAWLGSASQRRELVARVLVSCPEGESARVSLTYLVGGASWSPAYEGRADEDNSQVELALLATVQQQTGEDWKGAQLTLSTAIPRQDATPPLLAPLRVYADPREPPQKILVRRDEEQRHAESGAAQAGQVSAQTGVAAQGLSVQLSVREPADVPGDGSPSKVPVASTRMKAQFAWRAMPGQHPGVSRVGDLINSAPFPLLAGPADLYRRGGLVAHAQLERVAEGAPFHLAFGLEENLKVKRVVVEEIARDTGIFEKGRRFRFAYRYEVSSYLKHEATIEIADHIPVSELDDVEVGLEDKTSPGYEQNKQDGIVTWKLSLKPAEQKTLNLAFYIQVPNSYDSGGL